MLTQVNNVMQPASQPAKVQLFKQGAEKGRRDRQNFMKTQSEGAANNLSPVRGLQRERCNTAVRGLPPPMVQVCLIDAGA